jgi:hypothetical protein
VSRLLGRHPRLAYPLVAVAAVLGTMLAVACASLVGCGNIPQQIASGAATVDVAVERSIVAWVDEQAQAIEDDVAAHEGSVEEWCEAMGPVHRTAQRVICAARALGDLALAGQEIIDTAGADSPEWTEWLGAVPPLVTAVLDAFEAADYEPPTSVTRALRMLGGLLDLVTDGPAADVPCEVTDGPAECLHPPVLAFGLFLERESARHAGDIRGIEADLAELREAHPWLGPALDGANALEHVDVR